MWIDERLKQRLDAQELDRTTTANAKPLFEALWKQILEDVDIANSNDKLDPHPFIAGNSAEKVVAMTQTSSDTRRRECSIALSDDKKMIRVSGAVKVSFPLGKHGDGTVGLLNDDGTSISIEEASRQILDPLIFPDLHLK